MVVSLQMISSLTFKQREFRSVVDTPFVDLLKHANNKLDTAVAKSKSLIWAQCTRAACFDKCRRSVPQEGNSSIVKLLTQYFPQCYIILFFIFIFFCVPNFGYFVFSNFCFSNFCSV